MRTFRVVIETGLAGCNFTEYFDVPDDANEIEIEEIARDIFFNQCSYGYSEIIGEDYENC